MNYPQYINLKCADGLYVIPFALALKSGTLSNCLCAMKNGNDTIPIDLTKKHIKFFEFLIYNSYYPPVSNKELLKCISHNKEQLRPTMSIKDQITMIYVYLYLDIKFPMGFSMISDMTFESKFYHELGIDWTWIKRYFDTKNRKIYSAEHVFKTLKEFEKVKIEDLAHHINPDGIFRKKVLYIVDTFNDCIKTRQYVYKHLNKHLNHCNLSIEVAYEENRYTDFLSLVDVKPCIIMVPEYTVRLKKPKALVYGGDLTVPTDIVNWIKNTKYSYLKEF